MIDGKDVYHVVEALLPLYVAMFLAYASVRWWSIFNPVQCAGINRFVAMFAVPVLSFNFIASSNIYAMNYTFIAADTLHKVFILVILAGLSFVVRTGTMGMEWVITLFSLSSLPNTLIIGIPLLVAMYGEPQGELMVQIIVFQSVVWYNVLLVLFEYRAAKNLLSEQFPDLAHRIASVKVDSDVVSLSGIDPLDTEVESDGDGRLHLRVRKRDSTIFGGGSDISSFRRTLSDMSGVEIYSVLSSSPSTNHNTSSRFSNSAGLMMPPAAASDRRSRNGRTMGPPDLESFMHDVYGVSALPRNNHSIRRVPSGEIKPPPPPSMNNESSIASGNAGKIFVPTRVGDDKSIRIPTASVLAKIILIMVWRKLSRNPSTYASILGVVWSLIANRWGLKIPKIVQGCITIIANTGLGMAVFSLGLFMALQPKMITCGKMGAAISIGMKFLVGPAVMAVTSLAVGIRGKLLHVAIVQAALPVGIVPFVFAKEYDVHADLMSTSVIFGMLIALPITILYNVFLEL